MAAQSSQPAFLRAVLKLPHLFWGREAAEDNYPEDWATGGRNVTLHTFVPAKKKGKAHFLFTADDGDEYVILESQVAKYNKLKLVTGQVYVCF